MSLKHGLLGLLNYEDAMTGYELDKLFKNSLNYFWQAKTSQIYRELSAMEEMGWLTSERVIQEDKPNKRVYSITDAGRAELIKWLSSPDIGMSGGVKSTFLMRIFFGADIEKEKTLELLRQYREECAIYGHEIAKVLEILTGEELRGEDPAHVKYWRLTALHGEIQCKAGIEWADKAIAILEEEQ